mgnify:CR=1 FL=1
MIKLLKTTAAFIGIVAASAAAVMLGETLVDPTRDRQETLALPNSGLVVYFDPITKCQYLRTVSGSGSLTPRIAPDGVRIYGCGTPHQESALLSRR